MHLTIRGRLTLWYTALVAAILVVFSIGILWFQLRWSRSVFDEDLRGFSSTVEEVFKNELAETHDFARAASETRREVNVPGRTMAIFDGAGDRLAAHWRGFNYSHMPQLGARTELAFSINQRDGPWRVRIAKRASPDGPFMVLVAAPEQASVNGERVLARTLLAGTPIVLVFAGLFCWWAASRALRPVTLMAAEADRLSASSAEARLSVTATDDEVGQLGRAFNGLLHRLGTALNTQRQFMADASHELRTPVSVAQTAAEVTLSREGRDEAEYRDALDVVGAQTRRLGRMVDDMLVLARADVGGYRVTPANIFFDDVVEDCVRTVSVLAAQRGITLDADVEPTIHFFGDEALLRQLVINVLENGVKHSAFGGTVSITLRRDHDAAIITVRDMGPGIPDDDRERVFERFVRLGTARDASAGAGLGLPIARWIAAVHGGTLTLGDSGPGGSTFVARLPFDGVIATTPRVPAA
jgi:signal transduction histidine kinase